MAGEAEIAGGAVVEVVVRDGAKDGEAIGQPGQPGQVLANRRAGNCRGDGAEGAAHLFRGGGLGVPGVELALPAAGEDDQHGARLAGAGRGSALRRRQGGEPGEAQSPHRAEAKPFATIEAPGAVGEKAKQGGLPSTSKARWADHLF